MAERVPYKRSSDVPYGELAQLNSAAAGVREAVAASSPPVPRGAVPGIPAQGASSFVPRNEVEAAIVSPTRLPDQPITAGANFGPGPDFARIRGESDEAFLTRIGQALSEADDADARSFADRIANDVHGLSEWAAPERQKRRRLSVTQRKARG